MLYLELLYTLKSNVVNRSISMRYVGSKRRIAKDILPIILKDRKPGQLYIEPFVGGGNSFEHVDNPRVGFDSNYHVVSALKVIRDFPHILPKKAEDISPELYQLIKKDTTHPLHGYIGFACSFGGKYFGGRIKGGSRDEVAEQYRSNLKTHERLQGSQLEVGNYIDIAMPLDAIIYCDPPYQGTTGYGNTFDHDQFWGYCRMWAAQGNKVFISEYQAPNDFVCIWEKEIRTTLNTNNQKATERLFIHRSQV